MKKAFLSSLALLVLSFHLFGQHRNLEKAKEAFNNMRFLEAEQHFHSSLEKDSSNTFLLRRIADCAMNRGDFQKAIVWYEATIKNGGFYRDDALFLAQAYMGSGDFEEGESRLQQFMESHPDDPRILPFSEEGTSRNFALRYEKREETDPLIQLNENFRLEFGIGVKEQGVRASENVLMNVYDDGKLLFTEKGIDCAYDPIYEVFVITSIKTKRSRPLYDALGHPLWELKAYDLDGQEYPDHPFIQAQQSNEYCIGLPRFYNSEILFTSNQLGGRGGFDIYRVARNVETQNEAENLRAINTSGDECFAHEHLGDLLFSSNSWPGNGGFDLFCLEENALYPKALSSNGKANDYLLSVHKAGGEIMSHFQGTRETNELKILEEVHCLEIAFELPIDPHFTVHNQRHKTSINCVAKEHKMSFLLRPDELLDIQGSIAGTPFEYSVWSDGEQVQFLSLELLKATAKVYKAYSSPKEGILLGEETDQYADVFLFEDPFLFAEEDEIKHTTITFSADECSPGYLIAVKGENNEVLCHALVDNNRQITVPYAAGELSSFEPYYVSESGTALCATALNDYEMYERYSRKKDEPISDIAANNVLALGKDPDHIERMVLEPHLKDAYTVGETHYYIEEATAHSTKQGKSQTIHSQQKTPSRSTYKSTEGLDMKAIYFAYNSAEIEASALQSLIVFVDELKEKKGMTLVISAHTDARGSKDYNEALSQRRAEAVAEAMVNLGAAPEQIVLKWFGEERIMNECKDQAICSEDLHQKNRRADLKLLTNEELAFH